MPRLGESKSTSHVDWWPSHNPKCSPTYNCRQRFLESSRRHLRLFWVICIITWVIKLSLHFITHFQCTLIRQRPSSLSFLVVLRNRVFTLISALNERSPMRVLTGKATATSMVSASSIAQRCFQWSESLLEFIRKNNKLNAVAMLHSCWMQVRSSSCCFRKNGQPKKHWEGPSTAHTATRYYSFGKWLSWAWCEASSGHTYQHASVISHITCSLYDI